MTSIAPNTLKFLKDLEKNNHRDWFQANKPRYEEARSDLLQFVDELIARIAKFDSEVAGLEAKKCIFRIYRDTRFSANKLPYKVNLGAHIVPGNGKPHDRAGYYVHIQPGECFLAGGAYHPPSAWLGPIRQRIESQADDFRKILNSQSFKQYFNGLEGDQLKTAPKGYPRDHPEIELLRYKSLLASHPVADKTVTDSGFLDHCAKVFKALYPFDQFLNGE